MYGPSYLTLLPCASESVILQFDKMHLSGFMCLGGAPWLIPWLVVWSGETNIGRKKKILKQIQMQNRLIKQYKVQSCWFNTALPILAHPDVTQGADVGIKFVFFLLRPGHGHQPNVWIFKYSSQIYQNKYDSNGYWMNVMNVNLFSVIIPISTVTKAWQEKSKCH